MNTECRMQNAELAFGNDDAMLMMLPCGQMRNVELAFPLGKVSGEHRENDG